MPHPSPLTPHPSPLTPHPSPQPPNQGTHVKGKPVSITHGAPLNDASSGGVAASSGKGAGAGVGGAAGGGAGEARGVEAAPYKETLHPEP